MKETPRKEKAVIEFHPHIREFKFDKRDIKKFKYEVNKANNFKELLRRLFKEVFDRELEIEHTFEKNDVQTITIKIKEQNTKGSAKFLATAKVPTEPKFVNLAMLAFIQRTSSDLFLKVEKDLKKADEEGLLSILDKIERVENFSHFKGKNPSFHSSKSLISKDSRSSSHKAKEKPSKQVKLESHSTLPKVKPSKAISAEIIKPEKSAELTRADHEQLLQKDHQKKSDDKKPKRSPKEKTVEPSKPEECKISKEKEQSPASGKKKSKKKKKKKSNDKAKVESSNQKAVEKETLDTQKDQKLAKTSETSVDEKPVQSKSTVKNVVCKKAKPAKEVNEDANEKENLKKRPPEVPQVKCKPKEDVATLKEHKKSKNLRTSSEQPETPPPKNIMDDFKDSMPYDNTYFTDKPKFREEVIKPEPHASSPIKREISRKSLTPNPKAERSEGNEAKPTLNIAKMSCKQLKPNRLESVLTRQDNFSQIKHSTEKQECREELPQNRGSRDWSKKIVNEIDLDDTIIKSPNGSNKGRSDLTKKSSALARN